MTLSFLLGDEVADITISRTADQAYEMEGETIPIDIDNGVVGVINFLQTPRPDLGW